MMSSPWGWSPFGGMGMGMGMGMGTISVRALCVSVCLCVQRDGAAEVFFFTHCCHTLLLRGWRVCSPKREWRQGGSEETNP